MYAYSVTVKYVTMPKKTGHSMKFFIGTCTLYLIVVTLHNGEVRIMIVYTVRVRKFPFRNSFTIMERSLNNRCGTIAAPLQICTDRKTFTVRVIKKFTFDDRQTIVLRCERLRFVPDETVQERKRNGAKMVCKMVY